MKKYRITGINRLTGQREPVTPCISEDSAVRILERERKKAARERVYIRLRKEEVVQQMLELDFK